MGPDVQDVLGRFHRVLVREVLSRSPGTLTAPLTVGDIYYDLVPFEEPAKKSWGSNRCSTMSMHFFSFWRARGAMSNWSTSLTVRGFNATPTPFTPARGCTESSSLPGSAFPPLRKRSLQLKKEGRGPSAL